MGIGHVEIFLGYLFDTSTLKYLELIGSQGMVILWEHGGNALGTLQEQRGNGMGTSEDYYGNNMRIVLGIPWECYGNTIL